MKAVSFATAALLALLAGCRAESARPPPKPRAAPAMLILAAGEREESCRATRSLELTVQNTGDAPLWVRFNPHDGDARVWITAVSRDGKEIHDRCIYCGGMPPDYEGIEVGSARTFGIYTACFRQPSAGWYAFTAHYRDDFAPVSLPPNPDDIDRKVVAIMNGSAPPPGAIKLRAQIDSNPQWIYLEAADAPRCEPQ